MASTGTTKSKIRICNDCKKAPAKGIRSKRCNDCHYLHLKSKTTKWNKIRSENARRGWSPICEYEGCQTPKPNKRTVTKWCPHHREIIRKQQQQEYKQRARDHKIASPGVCQNPGCNDAAFSFRARYCSPCRKEMIEASKLIYRQTRSVDHNENNMKIVMYVRDRLNESINESSIQGKLLDTMECHRLATVLLQLRAWNSR